MKLGNEGDFPKSAKYAGTCFGENKKYSIEVVIAHCPYMAHYIIVEKIIVFACWNYVAIFLFYAIITAVLLGIFNFSSISVDFQIIIIILSLLSIKIVIEW